MPILNAARVFDVLAIAYVVGGVSTNQLARRR